MPGSATWGRFPNGVSDFRCQAFPQGFKKVIVPYPGVTFTVLAILETQ